MTDIPRVKRDLKQYQEAISALSNKHVQQKAQKLLDDLVYEFKMIDNGHASEYDGNIQPKDLRDNVVKSIELRRELEKYVRLR
jgi:hypothetical protein